MLIKGLQVCLDNKCRIYTHISDSMAPNYLLWFSWKTGYFSLHHNHCFQAITWTNADLVLTGSLGTNFNEIWFKRQWLSLKKMHFKMPSATWQPFSSELNVLMNFFLEPTNICAARTPVSTAYINITWIYFNTLQSEKMANILQTTFYMIFFSKKIFVFWFKFQYFFSLGPVDNKSLLI